MSQNTMKRQKCSVGWQQLHLVTFHPTRSAVSALRDVIVKDIYSTQCITGIRQPTQKVDYCALRLTFELRIDAGRQAESAKSIVEDLVGLERRRGAVGDLDSSCLSVKHTVEPQCRVALVADQHASLSIAEYVVVLDHTCASHINTGKPQTNDNTAVRIKINLGLY